MRSCIYCGKELAKGEKCTCAKSIANRKQENTTENKKESKTQYTGGYQYNDPGRTQYQTGYTRKDSYFKRAAEKAKARKTARRANSSAGQGAWKTKFSGFMGALSDPVAAVCNPKDMSMATMLALWALSGALIWLCMYFIISNVPRGPFAMLANLMALNGITGYKILAYMFAAMVSGAVSGMVMFFAYTGVFFAINRFVFRDRGTSYKSMCQRLAMTAMPFTAISIIGALISLISPTTLMILLLCGAVSFVVLTYEALKTQWVYVPQGKVLYGMMLGMFVLLTLICYIIIR